MRRLHLCCVDGSAPIVSDSDLIVGALPLVVEGDTVLLGNAYSEDCISHSVISGLTFLHGEGMFSSWWSGNEQKDQEAQHQDLSEGQHQEGQQQGQASSEAQPLQAQPLQAQPLRALWDTDGQPTAGSSTRTSDASAERGRTTQMGEAEQKGRSPQERPSRGGKNAFDYEDPEERRERRIQEAKDNFAKAKLLGFKVETVGEALEYCQALVEKQLERAAESTPPMNEAIYGDSHARRAITTLLPDSKIRELFLRTARKAEAWPRFRSLFGTPPYNFLNPEDAGLVRASGIARGRKNMAYDRAGQTATYSQFGCAHLVDDYNREYRVLPINRVSDSDVLPCDINRVGASGPILMNVRVPKRSRNERMQLLKDQTKRRSVVFPAVGETLNVKYSSGLKEVWGVGANHGDVCKVIVKSIIPRGAHASTAALVAVRVS